MVHLRVLLQRHIRRREQPPSPARRNLRIAHPLHRHHVRKRHRPLGLPLSRVPHVSILRHGFLRHRNLRHFHANQTTHHNRNASRPESLHRASLNPPAPCHY